MPDFDPALADLSDQLARVRAELETVVGGLSEAQFNWKPSPQRWSVAECIEHLAVTDGKYAERFREAIDRARAAGKRPGRPFKPGLFGGMMARGMEPPPRRKFKAPAAFGIREGTAARPLSVVDDYRALLGEYASLLRDAAEVDLNRTRVGSPAWRWLRLSVGDAFCVTLAHQRRHLWQAAQVRGEPGFPAG
ncbi:MAG TPA: DinB family protein [Longimicrobium sp.]|nr:DinB family protein [Longimicrobium sp.]